MAADTERLDSLIASVRYVLWDLDGPICRLFAGHPADEIARGLVELIDQLGMGSLLNEEERSATDPHVSLLAVNRQRPRSDLILELEDWLTRRELEAVPRALPTPYADPLIRTWFSLGVRFAITTNNSSRTAAEYIRTRGLADHFPHICGRNQNLDLMKPDPYCLLQALRSMGADHSQALMLGDAPTDYEAARKAYIPFLGYARNERKLKALLAAGVEPALIVSSLDEVMRVLLGRP